MRILIWTWFDIIILKKKIIITGALGYIGTELCKIYSGHSWNDNITVIDNRFISERVNQLRKWNIKFINGDILDKEKIILEGGKGGLGNWNFRSSTNQAPRYAQPGLKGKEMQLVLELKLLADVGLVGFPNVGKSTLLKTLTSAKPKIGNYEFTTLKPNLGIVEYRNFKSFVIADIPGIIEGASEGKGLGHYFLRHIERNSILLFILSSESENIVKQYQILLSELKKYNPELLDKDRLIAVSKSDLIDEKEISKIKKNISEKVKNVPFEFISSVSNKGLVQIKDLMWKVLNTEV